jgi:2-polyprenyl-3-methyl-5-hydroxy-6-metoxy-1,4-benzoquinol methylase
MRTQSRDAMATVFMKWLETEPADYDRGIQVLTLGRLRRVHQAIAERFAQRESRILEIGCGTGSLAAMMARKGAHVIGVDASQAMLDQAKRRIEEERLGERVEFVQIDASLIGERFDPGSFDVIVSTLVFSELPPDEQEFVLQACAGLLAPGGTILLADEFVPVGRFRRLWYTLIRLPLVFVTWILTRTTTAALSHPDDLFRRTGFRPERLLTFLGGSLALYRLFPADAAAGEGVLPVTVVGRLSHETNLRTRLFDLWALFFRIIPPYPKVRPGLYAIGSPDRASPVLVTGNFDLTVRRLVQAIDGAVDAWILVADSAGINVWCAAGGGYFTAEKVIAAVKSSHLDQVVDHHALVLPQLCANGVDGWRIRREIGWGVHWGPAKAVDIPAYLANHRKKTDAMRWVRFPAKDRMEMVTVTLGFYALLILVPVAIFWRALFWPIAISLLGLSYFYGLVMPWLPGRDGLAKSVPLTVIALTGLLVYTRLFDPMAAPHMFNWALGLTGLSVFSAAELQGMSPRMRGEQANWGWEAVIAAGLGLVYWLGPLALGWR